MPSSWRGVGARRGHQRAPPNSASPPPSIDAALALKTKERLDRDDPARLPLDDPRGPAASKSAKSTHAPTPKHTQVSSHGPRGLLGMKRILAHRGYPRAEHQVDSAAGPADEPVAREKCPGAPAFMPTGGLPLSAAGGVPPPVPASLAAALADDATPLGRTMEASFIVGRAGCPPLQLQQPPLGAGPSLLAPGAASLGGLHPSSAATAPSPTSSVSSTGSAPAAGRGGGRKEAYGAAPSAGSSDESTASLSTVASSFNLSPAASPCPTAAAADGAGRGPNAAGGANPLALLLEAARKSRSQQASPVPTEQQPPAGPPGPQQHQQQQQAIAQQHQQQLLQAAAASLAPLAAVERGPSPLPLPAMEPPVSTSGGQHQHQYQYQQLPQHGYYPPPQPQPYIYPAQPQQPMQPQPMQQQAAAMAAPSLPPVAAKLVQTLPGGVPPTAQDIILRQQEVPIWKDEDAPPGNAAFCRNPRYEEVRDGEGGGVDLLPRIRPDYMDKYELNPRGEKAKRARREVLSSLSLEEKMERRKERARVYSHIARRRQEAFLKDLNADVDYLSDFKLLVDESPHAILVLSADRDAQLLFVGGAPAARLHPQPKALLGVSLAALLHPDDRAAWLEAHKAVIVGGSNGETRAQIRCRVQSFGPAPGLAGRHQQPPVSYMTAGLSMRRGLQGVIAFLRVDEE